jgi:hypothetical protein
VGQELAMDEHIRHVHALLEQAQRQGASTHRTANLTPPPHSATNLFRQEGDYWTISYDCPLRLTPAVSATSSLLPGRTGAAPRPFRCAILHSQSRAHSAIYYVVNVCKRYEPAEVAYEEGKARCALWIPSTVHSGARPSAR